MITAKVIVTDVGGKGKKIFHYGDTVTESSFPEGNFDRLIAGGFLKADTEKVEADEGAEVDVKAEAERIAKEKADAEAKAKAKAEAKAKKDAKKKNE